ncbi:hypothetical protein BLS_009204 [Venturia inaequalis]|uniref:BTB domain-containing protein n=1 Tax=Venturia inaequalis TaxID=5025 RepID=A0A8H3YK53_VENIN|nr:hypothetical protein BLS_009204 [Venturia inaequalis]KAE9964941.1 hypothetical protein EG328_010069 [Venturia inaequalis]RDI86952.1 hypothetical protein Vi05172_g2993 [Venturia inaequalis]
MAPSGVNTAIRKCFESGKYSDLVIRSGRRKFNVHKNVVCGQSEWFEKAVKENAFLEGETGVISMNEDKLDAVAAMLDYLYTQDYAISSVAGQSSGRDDFDTVLNKSWPAAMKFNLQVYELANRFRIPGLKHLAEYNFRSVAENQWDLPEFTEAVKYAYSIAPPGPTGQDLRNIVIRNSASQARYLFGKGQEAFVDMMEEVAEFGKDLSRELASRLYGGLGEANSESKVASDEDSEDDYMDFGMFD